MSAMKVTVTPKQKRPYEQSPENMPAGTIFLDNHGDAYIVVTVGGTRHVLDVSSCYVSPARGWPTYRVPFEGTVTLENDL